MASIVNKFNILRRTRITEKTAALSTASKTVVFEVHPKANKLQITEAVESIFDVEVASVKVLNYVGKAKRNSRSGKLNRQGSWKKAYVSLKSGSIDLIEGL